MKYYRILLALLEVISIYTLVSIIIRVGFYLLEVEIIKYSTSFQEVLYLIGIFFLALITVKKVFFDNN